jgi:hypothetical protein
MRNSVQDIIVRHGRDRWKDAVFIGAAVLLTMLSIGSLTTKAQGHTTQRPWNVQLVAGPDLDS